MSVSLELQMAVTAVCLHACALQLCAFEFEVEGEVHISELRREGSRQAQPISFVFSRGEAISFVFSRKGEQWFLRTSGGGRPGKHQEVSFDGRQLYYLNTFRQSSAKNVATGWIHKETEILHSVFMPEAGPIWLAFASERYFKDTDGKFIEPVATAGVGFNGYKHTNPFKQRAEWTLASTEPFLPRKVVYFDDGYLRIEGKSAPVRRPAPYDAGFTNAIFEVHALTNAGQLLLPAVATLDVFRPADVFRSPDVALPAEVFRSAEDGKTKANLVLLSRFEVSVSGVTLRCGIQDFKPVLPGATAFSDTRFHERVGAVAYLADSWLSEKQVTQSKEFRQKEARSLEGKRGLKELRGSRLFFVVLIAALLVVPMILFKFKSNKRQRSIV